jgi:DMSO/TMAO reductase YedYZ molybdopterin-dependent catalytic subunit
MAGALFGVWIWFNQPASQNYPGEIRVYKGQPLDSINDFQTEAINGNQDINITTYTLSITGMVPQEIVLNYTQVVNNHPHNQSVVTLHCVTGWQVTVLWEGVLVKDLLEESHYDTNAPILIINCADGYNTSLPIQYVIDNNVMLAYKVNNVTLPKSEGYPFQLVCPGKLGYKWAKWVTSLDVSDDTSFRGYWESRGYSNDANWQ